RKPWPEHSVHRLCWFAWASNLTHTWHRRASLSETKVIPTKRPLASPAAHPPPLARTAFRRHSPEVGAYAGKPHVRICGGGGEQSPSVPRQRRASACGSAY